MRISSKRLASMLVIVVIAFGLLMTGYGLLSHIEKLNDTATLADRQILVLQKELVSERQRRDTAERDIGLLLKTIKENPQTASLTNYRQLSTSDYDAARKNADSLMSEGKVSEAMALYKWCYVNGSLKSGSEQVVIRSLLRRLADIHPEANATLLSLRDIAAAKVGTDGANASACLEYGNLNLLVNEPYKTLQLYDSLPELSGSKRVLGPMVYDQLVDGQRYADAVKAKPLTTMISQTDNWARISPSYPNSDSRTELQKRIAQNVLVLAQTNKLSDAQYLAGRILAADPSPEMRAALSKIAQQVAHPDLLDGRR